MRNLICCLTLENFFYKMTQLISLKRRELFNLLFPINEYEEMCPSEMCVILSFCHLSLTEFSPLFTS